MTTNGSNNNSGGGINGDKEAQEILIVPADRVVMKSTTCANCIGFDTGEDVLRRWRADKDVRRKVQAKLDLVHVTGLQLGGLDAGKAALAVSKLTAAGMTPEQAVLKLEQDKILHAKAMVPPGMDWAWADKRLKEIRDISDGLLSGKIGVCTAGGVNVEGQTLPPLSPLFSGYHCHKWCGRTGWSLAHNPDRKLDPLPAELTEIADGKARPDKA